MHDIATFLIIEHSQDVNARRGFSGEKTPLHVASEEGCVEVACILLKHGADIEARDGDDWSPLELATSEGHAELTRILNTVTFSNFEFAATAPLALGGVNGRGADGSRLRT